MCRCAQKPRVSERWQILKNDLLNIMTTNTLSHFQWLPPAAVIAGQAADNASAFLPSRRLSARNQQHS